MRAASPPSDAAALQIVPIILRGIPIPGPVLVAEAEARPLPAAVVHPSDVQAWSHIVQRIPRVDLTNAPIRTQDLLAQVRKQMGGVPNLVATLAQSPAALAGYLGFAGGLSVGSLSAAHREQISIAVGGANACDYCVSAHSALGRRLGLDAEELRLNLMGQSGDAKTAALLGFVRELVRDRGHVEDRALDALRAAGFNDEAIAETVANIALNTFTNYFNHVAKTEIDFPLVETKKALAA